MPRLVDLQVKEDVLLVAVLFEDVQRNDFPKKVMKTIDNRPISCLIRDSLKLLSYRVGIDYVDTKLSIRKMESQFDNWRD